jgi:hypothetical protein
VRVLLGAWGFDGRISGHAEGAPSDFGADSAVIPGFSFEMRTLSRGEAPESWTTMGVLLEHFRSAEGESVPSGAARAEGALSGAFFTFGAARGPWRDGVGLPTAFVGRFDILLGIRRGFAQVEVPDGAGGTYRKSSTWPEFAGGLRGEWAPLRWISLFARVDGGTEFNAEDFWDDENGEEEDEPRLGAVSYQLSAGVRLRPWKHASLLAGWRLIRLDGREITDDGANEEQKARVIWSGLWAGLELEF